MTVGFARPKVADLVFHLYDRSVHPELLHVFAETEVKRPLFHARIHICEAGHLISFRYLEKTITEVTTSKDQPLPRRKRYMERRLVGNRDEVIQFPNGLCYQMSFNLELVSPEIFLNLHQELLLDSRQADVFFQFPATNRFAPDALSLIRTEIGSRSLLLHTFHTFPENCAILRTQTLFEV